MVTAFVLDAVLLLFAASVATFAGTLSITSPLVVGVIAAVKVVLSLLALHAVIEALAVPPTERSDCVNPDTDSVNVIVALNAPVCVPDGTENANTG